MKDLSQDSSSPGQDLNPGSSEYEGGVLINQPQHLVTGKDNIEMGPGETEIKCVD